MLRSHLGEFADQIGPQAHAGRAQSWLGYGSAQAAAHWDQKWQHSKQVWIGPGLQSLCHAKKMQTDGIWPSRACPAQIACQEQGTYVSGMSTGNAGIDCTQ